MIVAVRLSGMGVVDCGIKNSQRQKIFFISQTMVHWIFRLQTQECTAISSEMLRSLTAENSVQISSTAPSVFLAGGQS